MSKINIYQEDCLERMDKMIEEGIKVDMIFSDLPYAQGTTGNNWDNKLIPTDKVFERFEKLITEDGAIVMTATMKFAVELINHAKDLFKYDLVWEKEAGTNVANTGYQPFRNHESILIFGKGRVSPGKRTPMKYNPQKTQGIPYTQSSGRISSNWKGGLPNIITDNKDGLRHPKTVQKFVRDRGLHPTQKPIALLEFLIKSYTNEGDLVFDPTIGSGTSMVAAKQLNRNGIGCELEDKYFKICQERIEKAVEGSSLLADPTAEVVKEVKEDNILF